MNDATDGTNIPRGLPWVGKFSVLSIAHRGFSGAAPENTLASFKKAMEVGADMIELDGHLSKEGEVVVIHDDTVDRTTNGKGRVAEYTVRELKQLDAGSWFGSQYADQKIPTLKEVLELTHDRVPLIIELKREESGLNTIGDLADRSLQEVEKAGMFNQVLFTSFDLSAIERIREKNPRVLVGLNYGKPWHSPQEIPGGKWLPILACPSRILTKVNISNAKQQGKKIFVWTLNTEEEMERFLRLGVDGIVTNHPDRLIKILQTR